MMFIELDGGYSLKLILLFFCFPEIEVSSSVKCENLTTLPFKRCTAALRCRRRVSVATSDAFLPRVKRLKVIKAFLSLSPLILP